MIWDSKLWLEKKEEAIRNHERNAMSRGRIGVYADTIRCVEADEYLTESGKTVKLSHEFTVPQGVVSSPIELKSIPAYPETDIEVWNADTFLAAKKLQEEGHKTAALNMANRHQAGGGVIMGAGAQEENLFRRSNLFKALYPFDRNVGSLFNIEPADPSLGHYPMDKNFGGIYAEGITVFRGTEDEGYPLLDEPYFVNVISVAAIDCPYLDEDGQMIQKMVEGTKNKIRTILRLAIMNGCDAMVLGAFGCGAFCNPPDQMARIFGEVFNEPEFAHSFRKIVFAILDDHNAGRIHNPEGNYKPFADYFQNFSL